MNEVIEQIYFEGDLMKTCVSLFLFVLIFEFVLSIFYIVKSAYRSVR